MLQSSVHYVTHAACLQAASKAKGAAKDVQNKAGNPLQGLNKVCCLPLRHASNAVSFLLQVVHLRQHFLRIWCAVVI